MAAKVKFAMKLYDLQQEVEDYMDGKYLNPYGQKYRFFVPIFGRQSGKSFLAKKTLLEHGINRGEKCMWVSPTITSARDHWNDLVKLIEDSGIPYKKINQSSKEIHFYGGGIIYIRTAIDPDNLRGATLDLLILDEAAYFRNGEYVWYNVCLAMITASRGIVMFPTTPNGRNWLYKLFKRGMGNDKYYKSWHMSSLDAPYQDRELLLELKNTMPTHKWRTEYEAEFLADGGGAFAGVERAATTSFLSAPKVGHSYVAGVDFGFNMDYTCFTIIDKYTRQQVYGAKFSDIGTTTTVENLLKFIDFWKPEVVHLEKNGVGETLFSLIKTKVNEGQYDEATADALEETRVIRYNGTKIRAIHMDNLIKRNAVERLSADIEWGRLNILDDKSEYGENQINEMSTYIREPTNGGMGITYNAQEGSHDDTVSGLYLAYMGVPKPHAFVKHWEKKQKTEQPRKNPFKNRPQTVRTHRRGRN